MTDEVRDSYDAMAQEYAAFVIGDLDRDTNFQAWLDIFAQVAALQNGPVADLGCGLGHTVNHLSELGLNVVGYDLSPGQIALAQKAFPNLQFLVGDLAALDAADSTLGGIVARYSLIHMLPTRLGNVFEEWMRVLEPGAPVFVSFFASSSADRHGAPFDHAVVTAYELFPTTIARQLQDVGFTDIEIDIHEPAKGGRPLNQGTVLAVKPGISGTDPGRPAGHSITTVEP
jgi:SAM-dependent methyltransferase